MAANQVENSVLEEDFDKLDEFLNETDEEIKKDLVDVGSNVSSLLFLNPGHICSVNRKKLKFLVMIMLLFCCNMGKKRDISCFYKSEFCYLVFFSHNICVLEYFRWLFILFCYF